MANLLETECTTHLFITKCNTATKAECSAARANIQLNQLGSHAGKEGFVCLLRQACHRFTTTNKEEEE